MQFSRVKGMPDILPEEMRIWHEIEHKMISLLDSFGFEEIRTPYLEPLELFQRGVGASTDIVRKEMFVLSDRKERLLALRPEGTASVVRAVIENDLVKPGQVKKFYYYGPMFRYERPQHGRQRQFYQLGFETVGSKEPFYDAETIALAHYLYLSCGIEERELCLELNSIGCPECRVPYRKILMAYLESKKNELCEDCVERMNANPLRVMDCKNEKCRDNLKDAPLAFDSLCSSCREHFESVCRYLEILKIPYVLNKYLVRGLDYYTRTAFEVKTGLLGAQDALGGGGRYDLLFSELGGRDTPAVGFAMGLERLILVIKKLGKELVARNIPVFIATSGAGTFEEGLKLAFDFRRRGVRTEISPESRSFGAMLKKASRAGAVLCVIIGEDELAGGTYTVKNMRTGEQWNSPREGFTERLIQEHQELILNGEKSH